MENEKVQLHTIRQVYEYIRDTEDFLEKESYICHCFEGLYGGCVCSEELLWEAIRFMKLNKPKGTLIERILNPKSYRFTKSKHWIGKASWWEMNFPQTDIERREEIFVEKRKYLSYLISKCK